MSLKNPLLFWDIKRRLDISKRNKSTLLVFISFKHVSKYSFFAFISELIISKHARIKGVGQKLIKKMEEYFKQINCEYILIDVFAYNKNAIKFYNRQGYHTREIINIKKI